MDNSVVHKYVLGSHSSASFYSDFSRVRAFDPLFWTLQVNEAKMTGFFFLLLLLLLFGVFFVFLFFVVVFFFFFAYELEPLRKHAYSNILKILPPKNVNFQIKKSDIFHICAQNIDCGYSLEPPRRGGSNEYPQSMFWAEIRKIMYTPVNPSFIIYIKVGFKGVKII